MEQYRIIEKTLEVYKRCDIKKFPIDCFKVIKGLGIPVYKYSELPESKVKKCLLVSNDAFTLQGIIFYNDMFPHKERQRFTLMHEVAHIVLNHVGECVENEKEADFFSSNILAPRAIMQYLHCESVKDIYNTFYVSCMAANRIAKDYQSFCYWTQRNLHKSICEWFFPKKNSYIPMHTEQESENNKDDSEFFSTHLFLMGEGYVFEHAEYYHLHGHNF
ncbi:ImmA/IrrE family metallo-endopeptidase [Lacrimispora celerecrescens]|uniref:Uncharacterized protein DUF955 n=1 Tax=[Clostridium] celerecrescens 18A TaxID=1286362 RepID=A0A2M8Z2T1_9FIRM|nr:ImmA/IrrE family metallo-endopeptidase [Lacrimispora celerecrescens]PJJ27743.1 uncharacterized protein DUF955 [[Clostridium] celerecrescens 18A]